MMASRISQSDRRWFRCNRLNRYWNGIATNARRNVNTANTVQKEKLSQVTPAQVRTVFAFAFTIDSSLLLFVPDHDQIVVKILHGADGTDAFVVSDLNAESLLNRR